MSPGKSCASGHGVSAFQIAGYWTPKKLAMALHESPCCTPYGIHGGFGGVGGGVGGAGVGGGVGACAT